MRTHTAAALHIHLVYICCNAAYSIQLLMHYAEFHLISDFFKQIKIVYSSKSKGVSGILRQLPNSPTRYTSRLKLNSTLIAFIVV